MTSPVIPELQILLKQAAERQAATAAASPRANRPIRWRARRGAVLGSLALVASASALAATHPWSPTLGSPRAGHPTTSTSPVPRSERALLGVLRRPQTAADRTPAVQATLRFLAAAEEHGVRVASIRSLGISPAAPGRAIVGFSLVHQGLTDGTVTGGANDVCVLFPAAFASHTASIVDGRGRKRMVRSRGGEGAGQACGNAQQLREGAIGGAVSARQGFYVFGLVPDGVRSVQISLATGQTSTAPVRANFYDELLHTAGAPVGATFTWLGADGRRVGPAARVP
jgi:hypothetical protein